MSDLSLKHQAPSPKPLESFERRIGYRFRAPHLLLQALTHKTALPPAAKRFSNERLEFLGDRVVNLVVADLIDRTMGVSSGGQSATTAFDRIKSNEKRFKANTNLARMADRIDLMAWVEMAPGHYDSLDAIARIKVRGDSFEALIAAIFIDSGRDLDVVSAFFEYAMGDDISMLDPSVLDPFLAREGILFVPDDPAAAEAKRKRLAAKRRGRTGAPA